jgi:hypothetical protein
MLNNKAAEKKQAIREWWADAPMTYAEDHGHVEYRLPDGSMERVEIGSKRFYELADFASQCGAVLFVETEQTA